MHRLSWQIALVNGTIIGGMLLGWVNRAGAQRRPIADDTLGSERSRVVPFDNERSTVVPLTPDAPADRIEGGARRGNNLFHSFREFHVDEGRSVYFADPGVENILSRVTGSRASQILGVLGVLGDANLLLINPSGIVFGENASLDVRGSFLATTADAVQFGEQGFFSATDPTAPPLLTVQPSAFLFNQLNPAPIVNSSFAYSVIEEPLGLFGFGLRVPVGESLTLLGGDIRMNNGNLAALGGRVEIGGLSEPGTVTLNADSSLGFPSGVARSNVLLTNSTYIDVASDALFGNNVESGNGGSITVNADNLQLIDSVLSSGINPFSGSVGAQTGDIMLNASTIRIRSEGISIFNSVGGRGIGNGGNIRINTDSFFLTNGAVLSVDTIGRGNAGNVIITARDRVVIDNGGITSNVGDFGLNAIAVGNGGDIRITTGSLSLTNGAQLQTLTVGQGNAGNVVINARDRVSLTGENQDGRSSGISSSVEFAESADQLLPFDGDDSDLIGVGNGGDIRITTGSLFLTNEVQLSAATFGQGNAGNVIITARDRVVLDDSAVFSSVEFVNSNLLGVGNGGDIRITTDSLSLTNGAQLFADTLGQGNAGNVTIKARDRVSIEGASRNGSRLFQSGIFTATAAGAQGRGGNVRIAADSIRLADGAAISTETENNFPGGSVTFNTNRFEAIDGGQVVTATSGSGQAGSIILNARDRITLSGASSDNIRDNQGTASGLFANTASNSAGEGGAVQLTTGQLQMSDQARIAVDSRGSGVAGNIDMTAANVQLDQARLTAETATADGGNITLRDGELLQLRNNSRISTSAGTARAGGNGGNIDINADFIVALPNDNSDIRANAFTGRGGNVRISTQGLFGIAAQPQDNPLTNDITASSRRGVQGTIDITTLDTDPRRGLTELPVEVVDASRQITQTCPGVVGRGEAGEFVVTGRGGLPPSPTDLLVGDESLADWAMLNDQTVSTSTNTVIPLEDTATPIVEAQGWVVGEDGSVNLVAAAPASVVQSTICR